MKWDKHSPFLTPLITAWTGTYPVMSVAHFHTSWTSWTFRLRNDLYCVEWGVKLYSLTHSPAEPPNGLLLPSLSSATQMKQSVKFYTHTPAWRQQCWLTGTAVGHCDGPRAPACRAGARRASAESSPGRRRRASSRPRFQLRLRRASTKDCRCHRPAGGGCHGRRPDAGPAATWHGTPTA